MRNSKNDRLREWVDLIHEARETRLKLSHQQLRSAALPRFVRRPTSAVLRSGIRLLSWVERHARNGAKDEVEGS